MASSGRTCSRLARNWSSWGPAPGTCWRSWTSLRLQPTRRRLRRRCNFAFQRVYGSLQSPYEIMWIFSVKNLKLNPHGRTAGVRAVPGRAGHVTPDRPAATEPNPPNQGRICPADAFLHMLAIRFDVSCRGCSFYIRWRFGPTGLHQCSS